MLGDFATMWRARLLTLAICLSLVAGCCTDDPADLLAEDPEDRREALACLAEDSHDLPAHAAAGCRPEAAELRAEVARNALRLLSLTEEPDPAVRGAAIRSLGHLQVRSAAGALVDLLAAGPAQDPNDLVRLEAVRVLGSFGGPEAYAALRATLRADAGIDVRLAAARELGDHGDDSPETTEALIAGLQDTHMEVRLNARRSLRRLHRCDNGLSAKRWDMWWGERLMETAEEPDYEEELYEEEPEPEPVVPPEEEFPEPPLAPEDGAPADPSAEPSAEDGEE